MTQSRSQSAYRELVSIECPIVYYLRSAIINDLHEQFHVYRTAAFGIAQGLGPGTANLHTSASTAKVERSQGNGHTHVIPKAYVYMK